MDRFRPRSDVCTNRLSVREDVARLKILAGIQDYMNGPDGVAKLRARVQIELRDYRQRIDSEISTPRIRIDAVAQKLKTLVHAIADGSDSKAIRATMLELEAHKACEEAELEAFIEASYEGQWQLPTLQEVMALVGNLDLHLNEDPELGLNDSQIRIDRPATAR